jgi:hypothetical protein
MPFVSLIHTLLVNLRGEQLHSDTAHDLMRHAEFGFGLGNQFRFGISMTKVVPLPSVLSQRI